MPLLWTRGGAPTGPGLGQQVDSSNIDQQYHREGFYHRGEVMPTTIDVMPNFSGTPSNGAITTFRVGRCHIVTHQSPIVVLHSTAVLGT